MVLQALKMVAEYNKQLLASWPSFPKSLSLEIPPLTSQRFEEIDLDVCRRETIDKVSGNSFDLPEITKISWTGQDRTPKGEGYLVYFPDVDDQPLPGIVFASLF